MALTRGECLLRSIRINKKLTQDQLSEKVYKKTGIKMSAAMISLFETSKRPMSPLQMRAMCITLKCKESQLYNWKL
ncbi:hypothetical protein A3848_09665 [Paenibacillus sp. P32E]|nr:hypothetical protein A3848_09665 [Paenibacillus sp. P32E]